MALQRPQAVTRLALINTLLSYRINHWRKWLEARMPAVIVRLMGMHCAARLAATRLFPMPWQRVLRGTSKVDVMSRVASKVYLGMAKALEGWTAVERLDRLQAKTLMIAAEHDFTPLAEKISMAKVVRAEFAIVHGSSARDSVRLGQGHQCLFTGMVRRSAHSSSPTLGLRPDAARRSTVAHHAFRRAADGIESVGIRSLARSGPDADGLSRLGVGGNFR